MTEHMDITRRKLLGAAGAVGLAGIGTGVGTQALLGDTESFARNTLAAGDLDLKVDWQQTYTGPDPETGEVGTHAVNAYPDHDGDGLQSFNEVQYGGPGATASADEIPGICCDCAADEFLLVQDGEPHCIGPIRGDDPVEAFYSYADPDRGTPNTGFEQLGRSALFLYEETGSGDLSLVVIHDEYDSSKDEDPEYVTFDFPGGLPAGSWLVVEEANDTLETGSAEFQWGGPFGDGGVYGHLPDGFGPLTIVPDFTESGITDWVALSSVGDDHIDLDRSEPVTLSDGCSVRSGANLDIPQVFRSDAYPDQDHLVELSDVKPGDSGEITFSLHNCHNPGYLWLDILNLTGSENGMTEPERAVDDDGESELAAAVEVRFWYDEDCDNVLDDGETQLYPESGYATVAELFDSAGTGISGGRRLEVDGQPESGSGRDPIPGDGGTLCIGFEWRVPTSVGNEIQSDSLGFDLRYDTEQSRNQ